MAFDYHVRFSPEEAQEIDQTARAQNTTSAQIIRLRARQGALLSQLFETQFFETIEAINQRLQYVQWQIEGLYLLVEHTAIDAAPLEEETNRQELITKIQQRLAEHQPKGD